MIHVSMDCQMEEKPRQYVVFENQVEFRRALELIDQSGIFSTRLDMGALTPELLTPEASTCWYTQTFLDTERLLSQRIDVMQQRDGSIILGLTYSSRFIRFDDKEHEKADLLKIAALLSKNLGFSGYNISITYDGIVMPIEQHYKYFRERTGLAMPLYGEMIAREFNRQVISVGAWMQQSKTFLRVGVSVTGASNYNSQHPKCSLALEIMPCYVFSRATERGNQESVTTHLRASRDPEVERQARQLFSTLCPGGILIIPNDPPFTPSGS